MKLRLMEIPKKTFFLIAYIDLKTSFFELTWRFHSHAYGVRWQVPTPFWGTRMNSEIYFPKTSLQIIFVYKQVICQGKDKFWPDK